MAKIIDIKLGEELVIRHKRKRRGGAPGGGSGDDGRKGQLPVAFPPPFKYIARKKKGLLTIYDMGTRLNQIGGVIVGSQMHYDEILFDALAEDPSSTFEFGLVAEIPDDVQLAFDARVLDYDPFGRTAAPVSARQLSNSMPLPFDTGPIDLDVYYADELRIVAAERRSVEGLNGSGVEVTNPDWTQRTAAPADASENWAPLLVTEGEAFAPGYMKHKDLPSGSLRVRSRLAYEEFDTGDAINFKVTAEPSFASPPVEFTFDPKKKCELFVKPRWLVWWPRRDWTWTRAINFTPPGGSPTSGTIRADGTVYLGPYASRLPILPKPRTLVFGDDGYAVWEPQSEPPSGVRGARLIGKIPPVRVSSQPSSAIRYYTIGETDVGIALSGGSYAQTATYDEIMPQGTAAAQLASAAFDASEAILAAMEADGFTGVSGGIGSAVEFDDISNIDGIPPEHTPAGTLCGVIRRGTALFYVWRLTPIDRSGLLFGNRDAFGGLVRD